MHDPDGDGTEVFSSLDAVESEWRRLGQHDTNVFGSWDWASAWWRHFGAGRPLCIVGCRGGDGRLAGLVPLYRSHAFPLRVLRFLGHGPSDKLGPICAEADRPIVAAVLARFVQQGGPVGWDVAVLEALAGDEAEAYLPGATVVRHGPWPVIATRDDSWEGFLDRHRRFKDQLAKGRRKLEREHHVRYRMSDDPDRLPHDFAALVALHEARWGGAAGHAFAGPDGEFHRDFTATALANGWLRLWFLEVDGTPIAAKYNFRYGGVEWGYQAGRDPSWDRHGVGTLLFGHVLEDAFRAGVSEYRMLRGDEAYKQRFATSDPGSRVVVASRGPVGRLAAAALTTAAGSPRARRWLSRAGR